MAVAARARCDLSAWLVKNKGCGRYLHLLRFTRLSDSLVAAAAPVSFKMKGLTLWNFRNLLVHQSVVYGSKRGNNSCLCAENQTTQRRFLKTSALRGGEFGLSPAAFGTN